MMPPRRILALGFALAGLLALRAPAFAQNSPAAFAWPEGKRAALSLSFDDARTSQVDTGLALFDRFGTKATFYVSPLTVEERLAGWKRAVAAGHEIGNHALSHPCTGNFSWSRKNALEDYTLDEMRLELTGASQRIEALLGVVPEVFAYPCGQTFVGRGTGTRSYVPLVAELFVSGRGWLDEGPNDPAFVDLAQVTGMELDGKTFEALLPLLEQVRADGRWLVLAGHEIGREGRQSTQVATLEKLLRYAQDPANGLWLAPVGTVARHIRDERTRLGQAH
jgi:peptidoglycan/xylan/chitin deacetylase (PgdA/CDA1 family)